MEKISKKSIDALLRLGDIADQKTSGLFSKVLDSLPEDVYRELKERQYLSISHELSEEERQQKKFHYCRNGNLSLRGRQLYQVLNYLGK